MVEVIVCHGEGQRAQWSWKGEEERRVVAVMLIEVATRVCGVVREPRPSRRHTPSSRLLENAVACLDPVYCSCVASHARVACHASFLRGMQGKLRDGFDIT